MGDLPQPIMHRSSGSSSEAADAFTVNWFGENNWWCPLLVLVTGCSDMLYVVRHKGHWWSHSGRLPPSGLC